MQKGSLKFTVTSLGPKGRQKCHVHFVYLSNVSSVWLALAMFNTNRQQEQLWPHLDVATLQFYTVDGALLLVVIKVVNIKRFFCLSLVNLAIFLINGDVFTSIN